MQPKDGSRVYLVHAKPSIAFAAICHHAVVAGQTQHKSPRKAVPVDGTDGRDWILQKPLKERIEHHGEKIAIRRHLSQI
jgi:hypothetical protein